MASATLSSARLRFTAEFGMESGGSTALWPPGINCIWKTDVITAVCGLQQLNNLFIALERKVSHFLGVVWLSRTGH